jgi:glycosyltransferase involved in cell wall biosynthesis
MSVKPTLVVLSPRFPYPIEKGDKLRLYYQLKALVEVFQVHLISLSDVKIDQSHIDVINALVHKNHILYQSSHRLFKGIIKFVFGRKPIQVNYYNERTIKKQVKELIEKISPDLVYVQLVRIAHMVEDFDGLKAIDYMDAMSLNMKREASFKSYFLRKVFGLEAQRILKLEIAINKLFDKKFIISEPDKQYLADQGVNDLQVLRNGVDVDFFLPEKAQLKEQIYDMAFVGNMGYLPNVLAAEFLVNKVLPGLPKAYRVLIAGARPHKRVLNLASEQVKISGWVDDIRDAYLSAKIIVAPIFSGAGQQNKILEAMSLGKVCITSTQVNKAIGAKEREEVYIADSAREFKETIEYLLNNPDLCIEKGKNARNFVVNNFQWESAGNLLNKNLLQLVK